MHRATTLALAALLLPTTVTLVAAPPAAASVCNPDFEPICEVGGAIIGAVNRACDRALGSDCITLG